MAASPAPGDSPPLKRAGPGRSDAARRLAALRPLEQGYSAEQARRPLALPTRFWERIGLVATDMLSVNLAFYLSWFARYRVELVVDLDPGRYVDHLVYLPLQIALSVIFVLIVALRGLYRLPRAASALDDLSTIFTASGLALMGVFAGSTFVRYPAESRLTLIFAWLLITVLAVCGRAAYLWFLGQLHRRGVGVDHTLVVGDNTLGRMVMQSLTARPHLGYEVVGFLSNAASGDFGRFRWLGREEALERVVADQGVSQVVITLPSAQHESVMRIVDHCRRDGVQFRVVPDLFEMSLGRVDLDLVSGVPLLGLKDASIRGFNFVMKRLIDLVLGSLVLVALSPVLLAISLAIKLDDGGPIFFGQTRVGRGGRHFTAWKFRSMRSDADELLPELLDLNETTGPIFKMRDDPRRTRVGRTLRRLSLDELPQLWNVLVGDMSLVGPRPPTPREVALYEDWHLQRLEALPGITGLWQVSGRSELGFEEMVMLDVTYIENWSLGLDLRILLRTIPTVLSGKGAF